MLSLQPFQWRLISLSKFDLAERVPPPRPALNPHPAPQAPFAAPHVRPLCSRRPPRVSRAYVPRLPPCFRPIIVDSFFCASLGLHTGLRTLHVSLFHYAVFEDYLKKGLRRLFVGHFAGLLQGASRFCDPDEASTTWPLFGGKGASKIPPTSGFARKTQSKSKNKLPIVANGRPVPLTTKKKRGRF